MDEWADLKELLGFKKGYAIIKCRRVEWADVLSAIKHATPLPPTERELSSALAEKEAEIARVRDEQRDKEWARWERAISLCGHVHPDGSLGGAHINLWELRHLVGSIPESVRALLLPPDAPKEVNGDQRKSI